jgi:predicted DNA-binding transcriptional regulator
MLSFANIKAGDVLSPALFKDEKEISNMFDGVSLNPTPKRLLKLLFYLLLVEKVHNLNNSRLSKEMGIGERYTRRSMSVLLKRGFLKREQESKGGKWTTSILWHEEYSKIKKGIGNDNNNCKITGEDPGKENDGRSRQELPNNERRNDSINSGELSERDRGSKRTRYNNIEKSNVVLGEAGSNSTVIPSTNDSNVVEKDNSSDGVREPVGLVGEGSRGKSASDIRAEWLKEIEDTYHPLRSKLQRPTARAEFERILVDSSRGIEGEGSIKKKREAKEDVFLKIIAYINEMKETDDWTREGGKYLLGLGNFLLSRPWESAPEEIAEDKRFKVAKTHEQLEDFF